MIGLGTVAHAQINSGSNGSDGMFNPVTNIVINMADHPNGIYQYTCVNISNGVTVSFIPNANNTPVTWLVQSNCIISGTINISGQGPNGGIGGIAGPGGYSGGSVGNSGQGPGGGTNGSFASYATAGAGYSSCCWETSYSPGSLYGTSFLLPLVGGSGGGGLSGHSGSAGGGGGGGAILIAASTIELNGELLATGGNGSYEGNVECSGAGSGGATRLVAQTITGNGSINVSGGNVSYYYYFPLTLSAGSGRIRFDTFQNSFGGSLNGVMSQGFQPIIIPTSGQGVQLAIASIAGASVSTTPTGQVQTPDAIISGQQANPIPVVVNCSNLPLNTPITLTVQPANGTAITAVGYNTSGTQASSTATILVNMPRGGGLIYATAATSN